MLKAPSLHVAGCACCGGSTGRTPQVQGMLRREAWQQSDCTDSCPGSSLRFPNSLGFTTKFGALFLPCNINTFISAMRKWQTSLKQALPAFHSQDCSPTAPACEKQVNQQLTLSPHSMPWLHYFFRLCKTSSCRSICWQAWRGGKGSWRRPDSFHRAVIRASATWKTRRKGIHILKDQVSSDTASLLFPRDSNELSLTGIKQHKMFYVR